MQKNDKLWSHDKKGTQVTPIVLVMFYFLKRKKNTSEANMSCEYFIKQEKSYMVYYIILSSICFNILQYQYFELMYKEKVSVVNKWWVL